MSSMWLNFSANSLNSISCYLFELRNNIFDNIAFDINIIKIFLEFRVRELITRFKFSVIITLLLDSIISQVNQPIGDILQVKIFAACSQIALIVPVSLKISIDWGHQSVASNVELSVFVEKRFLDVLLDNVWTLLAVYDLVWDDVFNLGKFSADLDATTSVCVFTWFNYPNLFSKCFNIGELRALSIENVNKLSKFFIINTFFNMEC